MLGVLDCAEGPSTKDYRVKWDDTNETWEKEGDVDALLVRKFHQQNVLKSQKFIIKALVAMTFRSKRVLIEWEQPTGRRSWSWEPLQSLEENAPRAITLFLEELKAANDEYSSLLVYTRNDVILWGGNGRDVIDLACENLEVNS
ncbi:hypothetical protein TWF481_002786 [Arthrobotrys musiformis]|uniref:Chromo domain-containing protein n=1 Tax=Arthrobotrys musiformis TaxID=47236 RepID=A0AAV9VT86_9PEZI